MHENIEVAIVGAGPAGISAACVLAEHGVKTIVLERGEYPGSKNISGGVLYGHDLAQILPDFEQRGCPIERNILESRIWFLSLNSGYGLSYRDDIFSSERKHNAFTVGRARFDRWYAEQARSKGALVVVGTVVTDLLRDERNRVVGVKTDRPDGDLRADMVLLADGLNSPLAAKTGFRPEPEPDQVALAVKEVIELPEEVIDSRFNTAPGDGVTIEIVGEITKGMDGIAVIYTNKQSLALCIGANLSDLSKQQIRPYEMMEEFKSHPMVAPLISDGVPKEYMAHWLAEGGYDAMPQLCGDGYLIAGDSAMLFNALHREGSNLAMTSGRFAAEAILQAAEKGDFSRNGLRGYVSRLEDSYVLKDLKKYRNFNTFRLEHHEIFTTLPRLASLAAREMLTVNGVSKKAKQKSIWREFRSQVSLPRFLKLLWSGWRAIK
jgi:electron transfer flavoprotein-quinone oxidoreductase